MNNVSCLFNDKEHFEESVILKQADLTDEDCEKFQKDIVKVSKEEADNLGKQLFDMAGNRSSESVKEVTKLLKQGANVNYVDAKKGDFPLIKCCRENWQYSKNIFRLLILGGANVNQANNYGTTALMAAARHDQYDMVKWLIALGADVNSRCKDGDTALFSARIHGNLKCAQYLINHGAIINGHNEKGETFFSISSKGVYPKFDKYVDELVKTTSQEECDALVDEAQKEYEKLINTPKKVRKRSRK